MILNHYKILVNLEIVKFDNLIAVYLKKLKEEGFCILPNNLIESLLKENTQNFELIRILQENLVTTVINLNATLNKLNDTIHENNLIIDQKLVIYFL